MNYENMIFSKLRPIFECVYLCFSAGRENYNEMHGMKKKLHLYNALVLSQGM